ncbi:hypothetical protein EV424DRAFT_1341495 [Suillus variegatus]|nr:hypothetical protein EV424DRAFT_1341495 [Suillus variegatus]
MVQFFCPAQDITQFDMDPQAYMDKVNTGEKTISAKQWPLMFYDMSLYDLKNKKKGFLQSCVVIQGNMFELAELHGIISLQALSKDNVGHSSKLGKGKMHHLAKPGIRNIMYAACQLYFTPSNAESWTLAIGAMNLGDLYYRAMCYLLQYPALTSASPHKLPHGYKLPNAYMSHQAPHGGTHSTRLTQTNMNLIEYFQLPPMSPKMKD